MDRVVDYWAGWYAATTMIVAVMLLGGVLWLAVRVVGLPNIIGQVLFWLATVTGAWLGYRAFQSIAKGLIFDPAGGTVEVPASRPFQSIKETVSLQVYRQFLRRERIAMPAIDLITERDEILYDSRKRIAAVGYFLDVEGSFGWHAIHFRSPEKRSEAHAIFKRLRSNLPVGRSRIPGTAGVPPAS